MTGRPPNQDSPPPPSSSSTSPTRLRRVSETFHFSLYKTFNFLSLLFAVLNRLLSKTLDFLSMDTHALFLADEDDYLSDRPRPLQKASELDTLGEPLYLVPYRWWSEARRSLFGDTNEVKGVLYAATSSRGGSGSGLMLIPDIVVNMMREDSSGEMDHAEEGDYALIAEWMFLRALKWHVDTKEAGGCLAAEDNKQDLFPLQIRLLVSLETNSLVVQISWKDNDIAAFGRASDIFYVGSELLSIWDFSGQTTQFFMHDKINLSDEIQLELQVYLSSDYVKTGDGRNNKLTVEHPIFGGSLHGDSLVMNGSFDNVNSYFGVKQCVPFRSSSYRGVCILGLTGLYNLGNTCFMNSAIQCLAHTPKLVDYFLGDFRKDRNTENPLGMNGELALHFGDLLRKLWGPGATPVAPRVFKSKLAAFAPQFSGYNQHDCQEFLAFLLDGLHEDLNRVKCKPYIEAKDAEGRPDEEVAEEYWRNHLARNDSIIVDMCQGQYRSTLVCPDCKKLSTTFDPFMYLSLPIPSTSGRRMTLTVVSTDGTTFPCPVTVTVPKYGSCRDLLQALSAACSLRDDETLVVAEIFNNRIFKFLDEPSASLELIQDSDCLVTYRIPKESETSPLVVFMHETERVMRDSIFATTTFGIPLVARISDLSRGSEMRKEYLKLLNPLLMPVEYCSDDGGGDDQNNATEDFEMDDAIGAMLSDRDPNSDTEGEDSLLGPDSPDFQFYLDEERGLLTKGLIQMNEPVPVPMFTGTINVLVSWPDRMTKLYDTCLLSTLPQICKLELFKKQPQESVTLDRCLEAFLKEEPLGPEDMWYCPNCKEHRQASKKLDLWRLPEILIIHLKRFSYSRFFKNKLETFVDFPILDFDLSSCVGHKNTHGSHRYMLYAVSNHHGGMGGGHYTAFAQHGRDRWYDFDDSHVSPVSEDEIKTSAAYVLFYRRIGNE